MFSNRTSRRLHRIIRTLTVRMTTRGLKMPEETGKPNERMQAWIDARKRHGLSHAEVQMARELGMNPENLRKLDNHEQETWKVPLRQFIQHLYFKRFGKERPDIVQTIEEKVLRDAKKKELRREARLLRRQSDSTQREEIP